MHSSHPPNDRSTFAGKPVRLQLGAVYGFMGKGVVTMDQEMGQDAPDWYWVFRYLWHRTRYPFRDGSRPEEKLRKRLRRLADAAEACHLEPDVFWNVYGMVGWYLNKAGSHLIPGCGWNIDAGAADKDSCWLVVRRAQENGTVVLDASRAWHVIEQFKRLHVCAENRLRGETHVPTRFSRPEYARLTREGFLTHEYRMAVERRLLAALGEAALYRASTCLCKLGVPTHKSLPPVGTGKILEPQPFTPRPLTDAYSRFSEWLRQATVNWSPQNAYPLRGQLLHAEAERLAPSYYLPFRTLADYQHWVFGGYTTFAEAFAFARSSQDAEEWQEAEGLMLMFGALDNLWLALKTRLRTLGLREDSPSNAHVFLSRSGKIYTQDRAQAYQAFFTPRSNADRRKVLDLCDSYSQLVNYLRGIALACDMARRYEAAGSFAAQSLELDAIAMTYGFLRRRRDSSGDEPEPVLELSDSDDLGQRPPEGSARPINLRTSDLRNMYVLAKKRGYLIPKATESLFDSQVRKGREAPRVEGGTSSDLVEAMARMFPYIGGGTPESQFENQLNEAERILRRRSEYPEAGALLLGHFARLLEEWIDRRNIEAVCRLLMALRELDPASYAAVVGRELCARLAGLIIGSYRAPAYADPEARADWQDILSQVCADVPLHDWHMRWPQLFVVLSALLNVGLTAARMLGGQTLWRQESDVLHRRLASKNAPGHLTVLGLRHIYPAQALNLTGHLVAAKAIKPLLDTASRHAFDTPSALVLMAPLADGLTVRLLVVGTASWRSDLIHCVKDVQLQSCESPHDQLKLSSWLAVLEDAALVGGVENEIVQDGKLRPDLPWDEYGGNLVRLVDAIRDELDTIRSWSLQGQEDIPTTVVMMPSGGLACLPWQLLINRYAKGSVSRARCPPQYLVSLCPSVGWWSASIEPTRDPIAQHTPGIYLNLSQEAMPDGSGGDYRTTLSQAFGVRREAVFGMPFKADDEVPCMGASLEIILAHGTDDASVSVFSRVRTDDVYDAVDAMDDDEPLEARICLMLACHGASPEQIDYNNISPLMLKLRRAKSAISATTVVPPHAALAIGRAFARELTDPSTRARCLDVYHRAIADDATGCVQLFQMWGANDVLVCRKYHATTATEDRFRTSPS